MSPVWWVWSITGLVLFAASCWIGGRGAWRAGRAALGVDTERGAGLLDGGKRMMLAGLTAGAAWLCFVASTAAR